MSLPDNYPLNQRRVYAYMADISTAGSAFSAAPFRGRIVKMGSVIYNAITVADAGITSKIAGTSITGGGWTIAESGSAAGDVDTALPTAAYDVNEDDPIEFISDGGSTTTCPAMFFADIIAT
ncbi:MAG TPA: hypothetical protein VFX37_15160 [Pseudolabrys sp.]|nr:hypothetical protein [Pseudolabrys sp.]